MKLLMYMILEKVLVVSDTSRLAHPDNFAPIFHSLLRLIQLHDIQIAVQTTISRGCFLDGGTRLEENASIGVSWN